MEEVPLIYLSLIYMMCLLICTPISGAHLNPAITISVWITSENKAKKLPKMFGMLFAQIIGGFLGLGFGRMARVNYSNDPYPQYQPPYEDAISKVESKTTVGVAPELLFCELFASFFLILVFLSLKYRTHLQDKNRDPVVHAAALATTLFGVTYITATITGPSLMNPIIGGI